MIHDGERGKEGLLSLKGLWEWRVVGRFRIHTPPTCFSHLRLLSSTFQ